MGTATVIRIVAGVLFFIVAGVFFARRKSKAN